MTPSTDMIRSLPVSLVGVLVAASILGGCSGVRAAGGDVDDCAEVVRYVEAAGDMQSLDDEVAAVEWAFSSAEEARRLGRMYEDFESRYGVVVDEAEADLVRARRDGVAGDLVAAWEALVESLRLSAGIAGFYAAALAEPKRLQRNFAEFEIESGERLREGEAARLRYAAASAAAFGARGFEQDGGKFVIAC